MMTSDAFKSRVYWLAYLGLLPLIISTLMLLINVSGQLALSMAHYYGAIVLTFIGAIHWGRAMQTGNLYSVTLSVLPSLYAFCCLLLPVTTALLFLIAGFVVLYFYDAGQYVRYQWFKEIRAQLTGLFCGLLLINWLASSVYAWLPSIPLLPGRQG